MKKTLLLVSAMLLVGHFSFAQYWMMDNTGAGSNPGGLNTDTETFSQTGLEPGWTQLLTGPSTAWTGAQTIPFSFPFNGKMYTSFSIHPNGVITFTASPSTTPGAAPASLPSASIPDNSICFWGMSLGDANDRIGIKTFGTAPNRQHWISWVSAKSAGTQDGWVYASIVLEENGKIHLVDQRIQCVSGGQACNGRPSLTAGVQINSTKAVQVTSSPNYQGTAANDATPADNGYWTFVPGTQPANDIEMVSIDVPQYLILGKAPFKIEGMLKNLGTSALTNYDLEYTVNGGAAVSANISGQNVATFKTGSFTHTNRWTPAAAGKYTITVTAKNPNGATDPDMTNNTLTVDVEVFENFAQRTPLYEVYTGSTCPPCRPGNANFNAVTSKFPKEYTEVKFQQNFPGTGDPYATAEAVNRRGYYGINSIPRMEIDGGWDGNANSFTEQMHKDARAIPSFLSIKPVYELDVPNQTIKVVVTIDVLADFAGTNNMHIAIVETETKRNVKTNGETEFHYVMKKMLPNENGKNIGALTKGQKFVDSVTYKFNGNYRLPTNGQTANQINHATEHSVEDFNNLRAVVWVQDANKNVLQSSFAFDKSDVCGIKTISASTAPTNEATKGGCDGEATATLKGGTAASYAWSSGATTQKASSLCPGNYTVTITDTDGCTATDNVEIREACEALELSAEVTYTKAESYATNCDGNATVGLKSGTATTYKWDNGKTTASVTDLCPGTYNVTVTEQSGCEANVAVNIKKSTVGVEEVATADNNFKIEVAPNPASTTVNISFKGIANVTILDLSGKEVLSVKDVDSEKAINIENLNAGVYVVKVAGEEGSSSTRLIIE